MMKQQEDISVNYIQPSNEKNSPCVKTLFATELSHYNTSLESWLPTEKEIHNLLEIILAYTDKSSWPDDVSFNNELRDRLIYTFREELTLWLTDLACDDSRTRHTFFEAHAEHIAKSTFDTVKAEYKSVICAHSFWGKKIGYFS